MVYGRWWTSIKNDIPTNIIFLTTVTIRFFKPQLIGAILLKKIDMLVNSEFTRKKNFSRGSLSKNHFNVNARLDSAVIAR